MSEGADSWAHLWAEQLRIAKLGWAYLAGYLAIATVVYSVVDIYFFEENVLYFITAIVVWIMGFWLLVMLMKTRGSADERLSGGIAGYFGIGILTGIPIGIGLIFFILPGLYLAMRWNSAFAYAVVTREGVQQSMAWSWENTEPMQESLSLGMIGPLCTYVPVLAIIFGQEFYYEEMGDAVYNSSFVALNLATAISVAWLQLLGVATYRVIRHQTVAPIDTFS